MRTRPTLMAAATLTALVVGLAVAQTGPGAAPASATGLTPYAGCNDLLERYRRELTEAAGQVSWQDGGFHTMEDAGGAVAGSGSGRRSLEQPSATGSGPTGTNVQEQGVDEPDVAKLADGRLLALSGQDLKVLSARAVPTILGSVRVTDDEQSYPSELLVIGDRVIVVSQGWRQTPGPGGPVSDDTTASTSRLIAPGTPVTTVSLFDVRTGDPSVLERATYDAQYVSARLVGDTVRLVLAKRPNVPMQWPSGPAATDRMAADTANERAIAGTDVSDVLPNVVRTDGSGRTLAQDRAVSCANTFFAAGSRGSSTLTVATLQPLQGLGTVDSKAVTTDGDLVYASTDRLYVATSRWGTVAPMDFGGGGSIAATDEVSTQVHAFDISADDRTAYVGSGSVPGFVYGRWAFSEHEGVLRVATTQQPPWQAQPEGRETTQPASSSMVVKLEERDGRLVENGRVSGLGVTEQIQAVRYFGDLAAVVTFRQTDPLYLLDLSGEPRVLGELKVPGFSTYLHPLGDGLLLGLGNEATNQGQVTGMQVSVFDISDPAKPRQVDRLQLGEGWSPALDDSRAFSYDPGRRLAALPFITYDPGSYLERAAAVGIRVGSDGSLSKAGEVRLTADPYTARVLMDDQRLYAVTTSAVMSADPETMTITGSAVF